MSYESCNILPEPWKGMGVDHNGQGHVVNAGIGKSEQKRSKIWEKKKEHRTEE